MNTLLMLLTLAFNAGVSVTIEPPSPTGYYACDAFADAQATIVVCLPYPDQAVIHIHPSEAK